MGLLDVFELIRGRPLQLIAVFISCLSAITDGMQYGWTSPSLPVLLSNSSTVQITTNDIFWLENSYIAGGLFGIYFSVQSVEKFGRKYAILIACTESFLSWTIIGTATNISTLLVGRFLGGVAGNAGFVALPMYIGEISDQSIRGFTSSFIYLMLLIGILMVYSIVPFVSIGASSTVVACISLVEFAAVCFLPKSPYHYVLNENYRTAKTTLQKFRPNDDVDEEFDEIIDSIRREASEKASFLDSFRDETIRKALVIVLVLNWAQHFAGISVMLMNVNGILIEGGFDGMSANTAAIIFSVVMIFAVGSASFLIDRVGRKFLLMVSSVSTGIVLLLLAIYFSVKLDGVDVSSFSYLSVILVMLYAEVFKCGMGLVPIVLVTELFPTRYKAVGMTIFDTSYLCFCFASVALFQILTAKFGIDAPFYMFSICCFITAVFTKYYVPETRNKSLDEIQLMLKDSVSYKTFEESINY